MTRLNVGCGEFYADGWLNIDMTRNDLVQPDLIASVESLPAHIDDLEAVYCGHVLEHLPIERVVPVLVSLHRRMLPGAAIMCVGPDVNRARQMVEAGELDEEVYRTCQAGAGGRRWDGDYHFWDCDERQLVRMLRAAGFLFTRPVGLKNQELAEQWPLVADIGWQCAATGQR